MKIESNIFDKMSSGTLAAVFAFMLLGCDFDSSDNLPDVPQSGLFMIAEANHHEDEDSAEISAAVFSDGLAVDLIGGDVFEAKTAMDRILLTEAGLYKGSYAASLPVDNSTLSVLFNVVHKPVEARGARWYPVDLLNIDPGPGELVGKSATVEFPPAVSITGPVLDAEYTSIDDMVDLSWVAGGMGDRMHVLSAIICTDGLAVSSYGTEVELGDDDGLESIDLDKFIYDLHEEEPILTFISEVAGSLLQELLNKLSAGKIDPNFLASLADANPVNSDCVIQLFLLRQRDGVFDASFPNGSVIGSRSSAVTIHYLSPNQ